MSYWFAKVPDNKVREGTLRHRPTKSGHLVQKGQCDLLDTDSKKKLQITGRYVSK